METDIGSGPLELEPDQEALPPGFGVLGQSTEDAEAARVRGLAAAGAQPSVPVRERVDLPASTEVRAAKAVVREMLGEMRDQVHAVAAEIRAGNDILRHLDVPLEQVADSHERATHSFETLRADIERVDARLTLMDARLQEVLKLLRQARG